MLIRTYPLPDELADGYLGRLIFLNRKKDPQSLYQKIALMAGVGDRGRREISKIKLLALASGLTLPQFISRHTTLPLRRGITSQSLDALHGDDANMGLLWGSALRVTRPELYFCSECINEDLGNHGYSYWRRGLQIPGRFWCPDHEIALMYMDNWEAAMVPPQAYMERGRRVDQDLVRRFRRNAAIQRFLNLSSGLIDRDRPFDVAAVRTAIKTAAAAKGVLLWAGNSSAPLLSDYALDAFDNAWLQLAFPKNFGNKRRGEVLPLLDGVLYLNNTVSDVSAYLLVASLLFNDTDAALNAFAMTEKTTQASFDASSTLAIKNKELLADVYVFHGGDYSAISEAMREVRYDVANRFAALGLPNLAYKKKKDALAFLRAIATGGVSPKEIAYHYDCV